LNGARLWCVRAVARRPFNSIFCAKSGPAGLSTLQKTALVWRRPSGEARVATATSSSATGRLNGAKRNRSHLDSARDDGLSADGLVQRTQFCDTLTMAAQEITAPFATPERSADVLGVSKSRVSRLVRWAREASPDAAPVKGKQVRTYAKSAPRKAAKKTV
jgi:hypothetical protein